MRRFEFVSSRVTFRSSKLWYEKVAKDLQWLNDMDNKKGTSVYDLPGYTNRAIDLAKDIFNNISGGKLDVRVTKDAFGEDSWDKSKNKNRSFTHYFYDKKTNEDLAEVQFVLYYSHGQIIGHINVGVNTRHELLNNGLRNYSQVAIKDNSVIEVDDNSCNIFETLK